MKFYFILVALSLAYLTNSLFIHKLATQLDVSKRRKSVALYDVKGQKLLDNLKQNLYSKLELCQPNGLDVSNEKRLEINNLTKQIEALNPTKNTAKSDLMNGFWRMLYTDLTPAAASNGKLGPFVGEVFQDLNSQTLQVKNLLQVSYL